MYLNFDVLFQIMDNLQCGDVLNMMQTCNTLYIKGIPRLFVGDMVISNKNIASFCAFMIRDLSRCRHLSELVIDFTSLSPQLAQGFRSILQNSSMLTQLTLNGKVLDDHPAVHEGVNSLRSLTDVTIHPPCADVRKIFQNMRSPVELVDMRVAVLEGDNMVDFPNAFAGVAASLQTLFLQEARWDNDIGNVVYPNLRDLHISYAHASSVIRLTKAFPKLRSLSIRNSRGLDGEDLLPWIENLDDEREANVQAQMRGGTWSTIETVRGDGEILYALGIISHIQNLHLTLEGPHLSLEEFERFRVVVQTARPTCVYLTLQSLGSEAFMNLLPLLLNGVPKVRLAFSPAKDDAEWSPAETVSKHILFC
jgi:hypothetical protein